MLNLLNISLLTVVQFVQSYSIRSRGLSTGPCSFPLPTFSNFSAFCQIPYHKVYKQIISLKTLFKTPYVCDPGGLLSRTETEILVGTVRKLNMTSCFCKYSECSPGIRIAIVLLPFVSWYSIRECDPTFTPTSISTSTILYSQLLSSRWREECDADVLFVYIQNWVSERFRTPLLVPLFGDHLPHLRRFSIPIVKPTRETILVALQNAMAHASRLIRVDSGPAHASIPRWALLFGGIMLCVVVAAIYIANCITEKMGQRKSKPLISKRTEKFRAGFGGGVMMNSSSSGQTKKSVMMFRTFSKSNSNKNNNRL